MPAEEPESNLQFVNDTQANLKNNASNATFAGGQTINDLSALNVDLMDLATVNEEKGESEIKERSPGGKKRVKTSRNISKNMVVSNNSQKTNLATEPIALSVVG